MTTSAAAPTTSNQYIFWDDPAVWSPSAVPASTDLDVVINPINGTNSSPTYYLTIRSGEAYSVGSLSLTSNDLVLNGTLNVAGSFVQGAGGQVDLNGGVLSVGSLQLGGNNLQGSGRITAHSAQVGSFLIGNGLAMSFNSLNLTGTVVSTGATLLHVDAGGFSNYANGTLTGGAFGAANNGALVLDVGGLVTTVASTVVLGSASGGKTTDTIASVDPATGNAYSLQSTMTTLAASGVLAMQNESYTATAPLSVYGQLLVGTGSVFTAPSLLVAAGGIAGGSGVINAAITDNGVITSPSMAAATAPVTSGTALVVNGDVSGSGLLQVGAAQRTTQGTVTAVVASTLELNGGSATDAIFADSFGTLVLDQPARFNGTVRGFTGADTLQLTGIGLASVSGYSYAGDASGGVLTVNANGTAYRLAFKGQYKTSDFALTAGPQASSLTVGLAGTETLSATSTPTLNGTGAAVSVGFNLSVYGNVSTARTLHVALAGAGTDPVPAAQLSFAGFDAGSVSDLGNGNYSVRANVQTATAQVMVSAAAITRDQSFTVTVTDDAGHSTTAVGTVLHNTAAPVVGVADATTGVSTANAMDLAAAGGPSYLQYQYIYAGSDNLAVSTQGPNAFLHTGSGNDALQVTSGQNVLDGGLGSNFMTGGSGTDTFFTDARAPGVVWNTLRNFHAGDAATLFGFVAGVSSYRWETDPRGAAGSEGATLRANIVGGAGRAGDGIDASITFTGLSVAQAQKLQVATGTVGAGSYLYLYNPGV